MNNAVMQPIAMPTIIFVLLHLSLEPDLVGAESKLNRLSIYF